MNLIRARRSSAGRRGDATTGGFPRRCSVAHRRLGLRPKRRPSCIPPGCELTSIISAHCGHKGLAVLASAAFFFREGRLQKCLVLPTPRQSMHLQTTGVYARPARSPLRARRKPLRPWQQKRFIDVTPTYFFHSRFQTRTFLLK